MRADTTWTSVDYLEVAEANAPATSFQPNCHSPARRVTPITRPEMTIRNPHNQTARSCFSHSIKLPISKMDCAVGDHVLDVEVNRRRAGITTMHLLRYRRARRTFQPLVQL